VNDRTSSSTAASAIRDWAPDTTLGALVLVAGVLEQANVRYLDTNTRFSMIVITICMAVAVALFRKAPGISLMLVWFAGGAQIGFGLSLMIVEVSVVFVAFGAARYGSHVTVILSGLSIPTAGLLAVHFLRDRGLASVFDYERFRRLYNAAQQLSDSWQVGAGILACTVIIVPWMAGLVLRYANRATASAGAQRAAEEEAARAQHETEQAHEIARLREEQTQLARDVHDVVGHSLAVILAQAESAQYLDQADTSELRRSMANIASSARGSLQDVRQVLTSTSDPISGPSELRELVDGVRSSGAEIRYVEVGVARPMPPELATVAYRVLQEMLTNAIRHGSREVAVEVELEWRAHLTIVVSNAAAPGSTEPDARGTGQGLEGMRRRLEAVGGNLDIATGPQFSVTARVPMRTGSRI
jgi:signal transduction histidine kinase